MTEQTDEKSGWRYKLGMVLFITPFPIFFATPIVIPLLGLSAAETGALIGGIILLVEIVWFSSIPLLGKQGFMTLKNKAFGWLKLQEGPISRTRHKFGVWLLVGSLFAEVILQAITLFVLFTRTGAEETESVIAGLNASQFSAAYVGIEMLTFAGIITSIFILGADFWERLKRAFEYAG